MDSTCSPPALAAFLLVSSHSPKTSPSGWLETLNCLPGRVCEWTGRGCVCVCPVTDWRSVRGVCLPLSLWMLGQTATIMCSGTTILDGQKSKCGSRNWFTGLTGSSGACRKTQTAARTVIKFHFKRKYKDNHKRYTHFKNYYKSTTTTTTTNANNNEDIKIYIWSKLNIIGCRMPPKTVLEKMWSVGIFSDKTFFINRFSQSFLTADSTLEAKWLFLNSCLLHHFNLVHSKFLAISPLRSVFYSAEWAVGVQ